MILREIFAAIGMDTDAASFAEAALAVDGIKSAFQLMKNVAMEAIGVITDTAGAADHIDEASAAAGMAAGQFQELAYGAQFAGLGINELQGSMAIMARKGVKDINRGFDEAANHIQAMVKAGRDSEAVSYAMEQFGRSGAKLVPLLKDGAEGLAKFREEAHAVGYVLDKEAIAAGVKFSDSIDKMKLAAIGLRNTIGSELLPMIQPYLDMFMQWTATNRELIRHNIEKVLKKTGTALLAVGRIAKGAWKLWEQFEGVVGGTTNALAVLTTLWLAAKLPAAMTALSTFLTPVIAKFVAMGKMGLLAGAKALLGSLLPVAGWLALAAVIVLAADELYTFFTGGDSYIGDFLAGPWKKFNRAVEDVIAVTFKAFEAAWESVKVAGAASLEWIMQRISAVGAAIRGLIEKLPGGTTAMEYYFGKAAASPQASVASSPRAAASSSQSTQTNTFQATFVNNGSDPQATASQQKETFAEWLQSEFKASTPAVRR